MYGTEHIISLLASFIDQTLRAMPTYSLFYLLESWSNKSFCGFMKGDRAVTPFTLLLLSYYDVTICTEIEIQRWAASGMPLLLQNVDFLWYCVSPARQLFTLSSFNHFLPSLIYIICLTITSKETNIYYDVILNVT